jgi:hypothetical protein
MVRIQVELSDQQAQALERLSVQRGVSMAHLLQQGVELVIGAVESPEWRSRRERALAALGCFASGAGNLAEQHDHYLAEAYGQ